MNQCTVLLTSILLISDDVMELVLEERQSINTLSYLLLIIMAFFGPNAELLGNIKLQIWQFQQPILDINAYILRVSLLMLVDLFSLLVNGILIWRICKVNTFRVFKKSFWYLFAVAEAYVILEVNIQSILFMSSVNEFICDFLFYSSAFRNSNDWSRSWLDSGFWLERWKVCLEWYQ